MAKKLQTQKTQLKSKLLTSSKLNFNEIDVKKVAFLTLVGYSFFAFLTVMGVSTFIEYFTLLKDREISEQRVAKVMKV